MPESRKGAEASRSPIQFPAPGEGFMITHLLIVVNQEPLL
jgi:hypothetical protein